MNQYVYKELDQTRREIRLLTLLPSRELDDPIRIRLSHVPFDPPPFVPRAELDVGAVRRELPHGWFAYETIEGQALFAYYDEDIVRTTWRHPNPERSKSVEYSTPDDCPSFQPAFEALSYAWGSDSSHHVVYVDSPTAAGVSPITMSIRKNLANALSHLRYADRNRVLWIDAICINQYDFRERGLQVPRMTDIYKYAKRVAVWLGTEGSDSARAFSTLKYLGKQVDLLKDECLLPSSSSDAPLYNSLFELSYDEVTWESLQNLLKRPRFERLWVTQEIQLANSKAVLQCGSDQISWYHFRRAIICIDTKKNGVPAEIVHQVSLVAKLAFNLRNIPFIMLLARSKNLCCSQPADNLYGILGLASPRIANIIPVNYTLPVSEVYKQTFLEYTSLTQRLEMLIHCDELDHLQGSPSWVPNWNVPISRNWNLVENSAGCSSTIWSYKEPNILRVSGVRVSKIQSLSKKMKTQDQLSSFLRHSGLAVPGRSYVTGESLLDAYAHILTIGQTFERHYRLGGYPTLEELRARIRDFMAKRAEQENTTKDFVRTIVGSKIAHVESGHIGLVPSSTKSGDYVCILLGFNHPIILRPTREGQQYAIVGGCPYIHGLMDAEALLGPLPAGFLFQLRLDSRGFNIAGYLNTDTQEWSSAEDDPRLGPRPDDWELLPRSVWAAHEATRYQEWRNRTTGEIITSDPRLSPDALKERGVELEDFDLV